VGISPRSNIEGVRQLAGFAAPRGYTVRAVAVRDCLHLKTACCSLGGGQLLVNRAWVDASALQDLELLDVPPHEPWAADVLAIGRTVLIPASFPETASLLEQRGWNAQSIDVSELQKAEAGVTCMSILLEAGPAGFRR
jgi:dimethylargininase